MKPRIKLVGDWWVYYYDQSPAHDPKWGCIISSSLVNLCNYLARVKTV